MDGNFIESLKRLLSVVTTLEPLNKHQLFFFPLALLVMSHMTVKTAHELTKGNQPTNKQEKNYPFFHHTISTRLLPSYLESTCAYMFEINVVLPRVRAITHSNHRQK